MTAPPRFAAPTNGTPTSAMLDAFQRDGFLVLVPQRTLLGFPRQRNE